ncbi:hypothetical protein AWZ03_000817 [Drosophila navojoa]|uniref:Uncharacterized protein n=1 Tax=Drosophila navojoa TaxID=7232 RepID=A0A484BV88_DRONA|nr:hypothetical protein AWZ03_000817 [Drosophila navojoa]
MLMVFASHYLCYDYGHNFYREQQQQQQQQQQQEDDAATTTNSENKTNSRADNSDDHNETVKKQQAGRQAGSRRCHKARPRPKRLSDVCRSFRNFELEFEFD